MHFLDWYVTLGIKAELAQFVVSRRELSSVLTILYCISFAYYSQPKVGENTLLRGQYTKLTEVMHRGMASSAFHDSFLLIREIRQIQVDARCSIFVIDCP